jgi:hypothetical protein
MEYQFRPLGKKCAATGEDLAPGSTVHSVVVEKDGEILRFDYSEKGWSGPPEGTIGSWTCVVPQPAIAKRAPLDTNTLMTCFEQLTEEANPAQDGLRYILALYLINKKRLRVDGSRRDGDEEYLQLAGANGEGAWEVRDPQPSDEETHELQRQLNEYLSREWA